VRLTAPDNHPPGSRDVRLTPAGPEEVHRYSKPPPSDRWLMVNVVERLIWKYVDNLNSRQYHPRGQPFEYMKIKDALWSQGDLGEPCFGAAHTGDIHRLFQEVELKWDRREVKDPHSYLCSAIRKLGKARFAERHWKNLHDAPPAGKPAAVPPGRFRTQTGLRPDAPLDALTPDTPLAGPAPVLYQQPAPVHTEQTPVQYHQPTSAHTMQAPVQHHQPAPARLTPEPIYRQGVAHWQGSSGLLPAPAVDQFPALPEDDDLSCDAAQSPAPEDQIFGLTDVIDLHDAFLASETQPAGMDI